MNLPSRHVVVMGTKRGLSNDVHPIDVQQMCGRAGRTGLDEKGDAYVLIPDQDFEYEREYYSTIPPITSNMDKDDVLIFHAIAEMDASGVRTPEQLQRWYARSLGAAQHGPMTGEHADSVFELLLNCHAIKEAPAGAGYIPTALGRIASWLYFDPRNVWSWACNLRRMAESNTWDNDAALAVALGSVRIGTLPYVPRDVQSASMGFCAALAAIKDKDSYYLGLGRSGNFCGFTESWAYFAAVTGAETESGTALYVRVARNDVERVAQAVKLIDNMWGHWGRDYDWFALPLRVRYGVGRELIPLVSLPGIGGVRAKKLWDAGFRDLRTVADSSKTRLLVATVGSNVAKAAADAARRVLGSEAA